MKEIRRRSGASAGPGRWMRSAGSSTRSLEDGASLAEVARRHDLNANQLFTWRRQFGVEAVEPKNLAPIVPVTITPDTTPKENEPNVTGQMEIVLAEGDRILVWSDVDSAALTRVLKALARR
ncbi:hypothetical protein AFEL58S_03567 [Afipia felis]